MKLRPRLALTVMLVTLPLIAGLAWARSSMAHTGAVDALTRLTVQRMLNGGREDCERWPTTWPMPSPMSGFMGGGKGPSGDEAGEAHGAGRGFGLGGENASRRMQMPTFEERQERMQAMMRGESPGQKAHMRMGPAVEFFAYGSDFQSQNSNAPVLAAELITGLQAGATVVNQVQSEAAQEALEVVVRMEWSDDPDSPCAFVLARQLGPLNPGMDQELLLGGLLLIAVMLMTLTLSAGTVVARARRLTRGVQEAAISHYSEPILVEGHDEISELAVAFNAAGGHCRAHMDLLEQRERSLREFVEGTTHDVMLPLTVLQGYLAGLAQNASIDQADVIRSAMEEAQYTTSLIKNLSTAATLEAEGVAIRQDAVDCVDLCERVIARHLPVAHAKGVDLEAVLPGEPVRVLGDMTLLEQALGNLVHNAVRYVDAPGRVALTLSVQSPGFVLSVLDDGPGIPEAELKHLTERRWRADSARTRHPAGGGLGLSIANEIILRHGMQLTLGRAPEFGGLAASIRGQLAPDRVEVER